MFDWKEFEKISNFLVEAGPHKYEALLGQHHIYCRPTDLIRWIEFICDDLGYLVLADLSCLDHGPGSKGSRFELVYHLLNMGTHQRINLHLRVDSSEIIPSLVSYFPHAEWPQREQAEMFGVTFSDETKSLLLPHGQKNWPLRKDASIKSWPVEEPAPLPKLRLNPNKSEAPYPEESYRWKKFDLLSPQTNGSFEWQVCFGPSVAIQSRVYVGFHHTGLEKLLENKDCLQVMHLLDIINPGTSPAYTLLWGRCLEELLRIKLPERAQAIRMAMLELSRIAEHLTVLYEICLATEREEHVFFLNAREKVYELFEKISGHRQGFGHICLGGIKEDLPHGWIVQYQEVVSLLSRNLQMINKSLLASGSFRSELSGPSVDARTILQGAVSGPAMRASGLNFDLRKSAPFYFYHDVDFEIPVGVYGTTFDRYLIRFEEIIQSFRIITQVIDNLPLGEVINPLFNLPPLEVLTYLRKQISAPQFHTSYLEAPAGEAGVALAVDEELRLKRVKLKTPSFTLAQALPALSVGLNEKQLTACVASLGIRRFEIDR